MILSFFFYYSLDHRVLHSFPTRRSSDLACGTRTRNSRRRCASTGWSPSAAGGRPGRRDRKSTRLNSSHRCISYAVFCLKKKKKQNRINSVTTSRDGVSSQQSTTV